jgi:hypothetical protein
MLGLVARLAWHSRRRQQGHCRRQCVRQARSPHLVRSKSHHLLILISSFSYDNADVQIPALRCLINVVSGCDDQTQVVIDSGLLPPLHRLLLCPHNDTVRKEACLIVSNITAGTRSQVQAVLDAGLVPTLIDILAHSDLRTKREACWALGNAVLNRDGAQIRNLLANNLLSPLLDLLTIAPVHDQSFAIILTLDDGKR